MKLFIWIKEEHCSNEAAFNGFCVPVRCFWRGETGDVNKNYNRPSAAGTRHRGWAWPAGLNTAVSSVTSQRRRVRHERGGEARSSRGMENTEVFLYTFIISHYIWNIVFVSWLFSWEPTALNNYGSLNWSWATWSSLRPDNRPKLEREKPWWTVVQAVHFLRRELPWKAELRSSDAASVCA